MEYKNLRDLRIEDVLLNAETSKIINPETKNYVTAKDLQNKYESAGCNWGQCVWNQCYFK